MSVYIIRKIEMLYKLIKDTIEAIWSNTTISTFTNIGNQKRISFTVDGKEATIDVYQKKDVGVMEHKYKTKLIRSYNLNDLRRKKKFDSPCAPRAWLFRRQGR